MAGITILDNEYVTLWYLPDKKIIHHQFHKFMHGQAFRDALNAGTNAMKKYGAQKWLSDDRQNSALPKVDIEWATTEWFARSVLAGWKYWALVLPKDIIGQMNMNRGAKYNTDRGIIVAKFDNLDEAMTWLEKQ